MTQEKCLMPRSHSYFSGMSVDGDFPISVSYEFVNQICDVISSAESVRYDKFGKLFLHAWIWHYFFYGKFVVYDVTKC